MYKMKEMYKYYAEYVLRNPSSTMGQPIKASKFDLNINQILENIMK